MSSPVLVPPYPKLPVTLDEAKSHLRGLEGDDAYILSCIRRATNHAERYLKRALIERTYDLHRDNWFSTLALPMPPAIAVDSINYLDENNQEQVADPALYQADTISDPGVIYRLPGQCWPELVDRETRLLNRVRIRYSAGYGQDLHTVEPKIIGGVLQLIAHYNRERQVLGANTVTALALTGEALLMPFVHHPG